MQDLKNIFCFLIFDPNYIENKISCLLLLPMSKTSLFCTMNFSVGLLPSKSGDQLTFTALWYSVSSLFAFTLTGGNGNSTTLRCATRVSFPPADDTSQVYTPTSAARTACISNMPSVRTWIRWLLPGIIFL